MTRSRLRGLRAACVMTLLAGLAAAATPASAAQAHTGQARTAAAAVPSLLTEEQAQVQAESTGQPVTATAVSTETMSTVANPDGSFTTTVSAQPAQAMVNGAWTPLNAALQQNSSGSYSPTVSTEPLTLSGGGSTTLATMAADGRTLSLSWPGTLPAPTVSGATATYANVYPDVDLVVTADEQGGFSDTLVVHTATAAANPALASLQLTTNTSGGLVLSTDASGDLIAAADASAPPLLSFDAPQVWDSTPPPATETTVTNTDGVTVDAASGDPVTSTITGPGTGAQVATVPVSVSGDTITLTPPASILTGSGTTYPVYIDPAWHNYAASHASAWTQVFSGYPTETSMYDANEDLRVDVCPVDLAPNCNSIGTARSFIQMPVPTQLRASTDVHSADLYMTEDWAPSCTKESVRLYPVSGSISRSTDWNNAPAMPDTGASWVSQSAAFGYPGCGYYKNDITWNVTSDIAADAGHASHQTWGLRADDESTSDIGTSELYWKKFKSGASNFTLSVIYNYPPNQPTHLSTDPGGGCHIGENNPAVIGNDDVTFYSYADDSDGDNDLSTAINLYTPSGTSVFSTTVKTGDKSVAQTTILRAGMQSYGANGSTTAYKYYYQTQVTDDFGLKSPKSWKCWIYYNPKGPQKPTVTVSPGSVTLGGQVAATFSSPGCSATTNPCPVKYVYQEGAGAPVTETANSTTHEWSGNITITHVGPVEIIVHAVDSAGNKSEFSAQPVIGTVPTTKYKDGYFTDGPYPDLLGIGTGAKPSLWLSTGSGNGTLNPPVDVGSLGTSINPGTDGRGDWADAIILHGDFTGHNVQDVMAYYPSTGSGVVIGGSGDAFSLDPWSGNTGTVDSSLMSFGPTGTPPIQLTAAGNASGLSTGTDDLIGITTDSGGTSELDLYTSSLYPGGGTASTYSYCQTITTAAPGGSSDSWANYQLATTGNPSSTVLFALNTTNGALYESTGPFTLQVPAGSPTGTTPSCYDTIKQPTWTKITVPWNSGYWPGDLQQGDINNTGQTELWIGDFPYTLSGTALSQESFTAAVVGSPAIKNEWALNDGDPNLGSTNLSTALDSITGTNATLTGGTAWVKDSYFTYDLGFDGTSGYATPPASTISHTPLYLSVWFKTTTAGGVLVSTQGAALSSGSTTTAGYDPVMYVGEDGILHAEWWNGSIDTLASTYKVDDGVWHHAELVSKFIPISCGTPGCFCPCPSTNVETLYLDSVQQQVSGQAVEDGNWANLDFGAGYIGGGWPDEINYEKNANEGYIQYFNGEIADISLNYGIPPLLG